MEKNSNCETALTWTPEGKRKVGRPKTSGDQLLKMKDVYWGGIAGTKPDV